MARYIYCRKCAADYQQTMDPEDVANGWQQRIVNQPVRKPKEHYVVVNGKRIDLQFLKCDRCDHIIEDGATALLVTLWRGQEPPDWEHEYVL